jgi:putative phage-type endonuclease
MKYFNVEQGSEEWVKLRLGVPTASDCTMIMTPKKMELSKQSDKLIARLISEKLSPYLPERAETFSSRAMEWGKQTEEEARRFYAMERNVTVMNGGFCLSDDGRIGCSPDGVVGEDGILELKAPNPSTHVEYLMEGGVPFDYMPQIHFQLIVTGCKWVDFMSYAQGLPPLLVRVEPGLYTEQLKKLLYDEFLPRFDEVLARFAE